MPQKKCNRDIRSDLHLVSLLLRNENKRKRRVAILKTEPFTFCYMKGETPASLKGVVEKIYREGMIHVTIHRIRRSSRPPQAEFYCGDKRCHVMSSPVIVDADGLMVTGDSIRPLTCTTL